MTTCSLLDVSVLKFLIFKQRSKKQLGLFRTGPGSHPSDSPHRYGSTAARARAWGRSAASDGLGGVVKEWVESELPWAFVEISSGR